MGSGFFFLGDVELLFAWSDGKQIRARNYDESIWKPALATAGVIPLPTRDNRGRRHYATDRKTGLHALRHHYASVTLHDGVNIKELAEYLGHHDPRVHASYVHASSAVVTRQSPSGRRSPDGATPASADGAVTEQRRFGGSVRAAGRARHGLAGRPQHKADLRKRDQPRPFRS